MAISHFTLATRDVPRASRFFQATLGWQPINRPGNIPMESDWLRIAAEQELHLVKVDGFEPSPFESEFGRHFAVTFPLNGFSDLKQRLERHGAELIAPQRETPFERFFFRNPDGYVFEVIEAERE